MTRKRFGAGCSWQSGVSPEVLDHEPAIVVARIQARADSRRADIQFQQLLGGPRHIVGSALDARGVATELLAERDRHRILQMRPARFQHVGELVCLAGQAPGELRAPRWTSGPELISSARRVAVGKTSFVDWPMLT